MSEAFRWVPDVARGEWLRGMGAQRSGSLLSVVPAGFEAYARVFHPVERDRPLGTGTWHGVDRETFFEGVDGVEPSIETEPATWAQAAASFGTTMHAEAQYDRLLRRADAVSRDGAVAPDGWRYAETEEGCLEVGSLTAVAAVLARHTSTPGAGIAAIWEGWGGLVSLDGTGLLPREIAAGARFELTPGMGRGCVLFEAGADDFARTDWPTRAPWVDEPVWAPSPSILWPEDHAWVLATEIDFDSTLVAGTAALIRELLRTPGLEVLPLRAGADLTSEGDGLNRPA